MIEIRVKKTHPAFDLDVDARSRARVIGIVGPSGAGKTTLLSAIAGVAQPCEASVQVDNVEIATAPCGTPIPPNARGIGYVFQDALLFPHMTVRQNLLYALGNRCSPIPPNELIDLLELSHLLDRKPHEVSGGEQRRVAVGRAILSAPQLLLLDEPLTGLDRDRAGNLLALLADLRDRLQLPILYASHDLSSVQFLCEETWILSSGRVIQTCPAEETFLHAEPTGNAHAPSITNLVRGACTSSTGGIASFPVGDNTLHAVAQTRPGEQAILAIRSTEIILAAADPGPLSARNILRGTVTRIGNSGGAKLVCIDVGTPLWVQLTGAAVTELALAPGKPVKAIIKASAVSALSGTSHSPPRDATSAASSDSRAPADTA